MIRAALVAVAVAVGAAAPLDLSTLFPPEVPPGFVVMPDQAGRLGPLDAATAAAELDRTGRTTAEQLGKAGFVHGHSRAWSKADSQEVVLDVLLQFRDRDTAGRFVEGVVAGRERLERVPVGVPGVEGFRRGPPTPTATDPGQLEAVLRVGPLVAIVVAAGHAAYPAPELLSAVAARQQAVLRPLFPEKADAPKAGRRSSVGGWGLLAIALLAVVSWATAREAGFSPRAR